LKRVLPIILFTFSLIGSYNSLGQVKSDSIVINRSSVFIEFGGNAPFISLNYDYLILTKKENIKCAFTIGTTHHFNNPYDIVIAPQFNILVGKKIMAEIGAGITIPISYISDGVFVPRIGGRYQKMGGGMIFRLAFTPIIAPNSNTSFLPMIGISIGYTFTHNRKK
jgi:hypothetical protein